MKGTNTASVEFTITFNSKPTLFVVIIDDNPAISCTVYDGEKVAGYGVSSAVKTSDTTYKFKLNVGGNYTVYYV